LTEIYIPNSGPLTWCARRGRVVEPLGRRVARWAVVVGLLLVCLPAARAERAQVAALPAIPLVRWQPKRGSRRR